MELNELCQLEYWGFVKLKNINPFPIRFELVDQLPISQTKSAEVELEKSSNGVIDVTSGDVTWLVDLKPGQAQPWIGLHHWNGRKLPV